MQKIKNYVKKEWKQIEKWLKDEKSVNGLGENGTLTAFVILAVVVAALILWPYFDRGANNVGSRFENATKDGSQQNWSSIQP